VAGKGGMGLVSIRERAERVGGLLTILSAPGEGTRVKISIEANGNTPHRSRSLIGSLGFPEVLK